MSKTDSNSDIEQTPIIVDVYGIKMKGSPDDLGEEVPTSWREVLLQVNRHLMRIAAAPTRLIANVLEGATRVVRGLSRIPRTIERRVQRAHEEADSVEQQRQAAVSGKKQGQLSPSKDLQDSNNISVEDKAKAAVAQIQAVIQKYRDRGFDAYVVLDSNGTITIVIGTPPGSEALVREAIEQVQSISNNSYKRDR